MESYLFRNVEASAENLVVEGWHKPGSLTRSSGAWIHAAGSAMLESEGFAWAGRGCYADATATVKSCAKELRPFGIPRAAQGSSVRATVRKITSHMLFCAHEKRPENCTFRTLFIGVTTGALFPVRCGGWCRFGSVCVFCRNGFLFLIPLKANDIVASIGQSDQMKIHQQLHTGFNGFFRFVHQTGNGCIVQGNISVQHQFAFAVLFDRHAEQMQVHN